MNAPSKVSVGREIIAERKDFGSYCVSVYAGMPSEESFSIVTQIQSESRNTSCNLYFPKNQKEINFGPAYNERVFKILEVNPEFIKVEELEKKVESK
jgi:hypothetical protein